MPLTFIRTNNVFVRHLNTLVNHSIAMNFTLLNVFCLDVNASSCISCLQEGRTRPNPEEFMKYVTWFLSDNPGTTTTACTKG